MPSQNGRTVCKTINLHMKNNKAFVFHSKSDAEKLSKEEILEKLRRAMTVFNVLTKVYAVKTDEQFADGRLVTLSTLGVATL